MTVSEVFLHAQLDDLRLSMYEYGPLADGHFRVSNLKPGRDGTLTEICLCADRVTDVENMVTQNRIMPRCGDGGLCSYLEMRTMPVSTCEKPAKKCPWPSKRGCPGASAPIAEAHE